MASLTQWIWFGWTPGVSDGQGGLHAAIHGVTKSWTLMSD